MGNIRNYKNLRFFDTETTSLDYQTGEIIQFAVLEEDSNGSILEQSFRIKPSLKEGTYQKDALRINRYAPELWQDAISWSEAAPRIVQALSGWDPIIAHNALFDIQFIESCLLRSGWKKGSRTDIDNKIFRLGYPIIDTVSLAWMCLNTERQNLMSLREHLNIPKEGGHEAVKDVQDTRVVFWNCVLPIIGGE